jgi:ParB-like chromosome segregation protein Spo0J
METTMTTINKCESTVNGCREIKIGKTTFKVLFPDLIRPLTPAEREGLKRSIEQAGRVENPVVVTQGMGIIDGLNRVEIAEELGFKNVPIMMTPSKDPEEWRRLAIDLNVERRQLTPEEKVRLRLERQERVAEAHAKGESTRAIAAREGVAQSTVVEDIKAASGDRHRSPEGSGQESGSAPSVPPAKVRGRDGKEYAAKAKPGRKAKSPAEAPATDAVGIPLDAKMQEVFRVRQLFARARQMHRELAEVNNLICQSPGGERFRVECHYIRSGTNSGW